MTKTEILVQNMFDDLSPSEQLAAKFFLENTEKIYSCPVAKLAKMSGTSQGAWIRFCQSIGFAGIKELKNSLFLETNQTKPRQEVSKAIPFSDIQDFDSTKSLASHIFENSISAIEDTYKLINYDELDLVSDLIIKARSIRFFGVGASSLVAQDLFSKLIRLGYNAIYDKDLHMQYMMASASNDKDIAIIFSNSGLTKEVLKIADILHSVNTPICAITQYKSNNPLMQKADYCLNTSTKEAVLRSAATSSRISQLCVSDVLFMTVASKDIENIEDKLHKSYDNCHPTI